MSVGDIVIVKKNPDIGDKWQGKQAKVIQTDLPGRYSIRLQLDGHSPTSIFEPTDVDLCKEYNVKKLLTKLKL